MENVCNAIIESMSLGVYISVPFCRTKCSYCNFASDVFSRTVFERYVDRVCLEIADARSTAKQIGGLIEAGVDSIYLGGGTPTVLEPAQLKRIFDAVRAEFSVQDSAEITVECAPGTLSPAVLEALRQCGVNRVSLGVQSFVDAEAAAVGRLHKSATVIEHSSEVEVVDEAIRTFDNRGTGYSDNNSSRQCPVAKLKTSMAALEGEDAKQGPMGVHR